MYTSHFYGGMAAPAEAAGKGVKLLVGRVVDLDDVGPHAAAARTGHPWAAHYEEGSGFSWKKIRLLTRHLLHCRICEKTVEIFLSFL